jgi:hypothetical protein
MQNILIEATQSATHTKVNDDDKKSLKCVKESPMPEMPFVLGVLCLLDVPCLLGVFFLSCDLESRTKAEPSIRHDMNFIPFPQLHPSSTSSILNFIHPQLLPSSTSSRFINFNPLHQLHPSIIFIPPKSKSLRFVG